MRTTLGILAVTAVLAAGCATTGGAKVPPEQAVRAMLDNHFKPGLEQTDSAVFMQGVSESFKSGQFSSKQGLKSGFDQYVAEGSLNNAKVDMEKAAITAMDDGSYRAYPVRVTTSAGMATCDIRAKQDADGVWRITGMSVVTY
jgi:hypothetical protein